MKIITVFLIFILFSFNSQNSQSLNHNLDKNNKSNSNIVMCSNFPEPVKEEKGRCYGYINCTACSNCNYCAHCNNGGACGVCSPVDKNKAKTTQKNNNYFNNDFSYRSPEKQMRSRSLRNINSDPIEKSEIETWLTSFYSAMDSRDYSKIKSFYSSEITRYYSNYYLSPQKVIEISKAYYKKYPYTNTLILPNSISTKRINNEILIEYELEYFVKKESWSRSKYFELNMFIKLNSDGKIVEIWESKK